MGSNYAATLTPAIAFETSPNIRKLIKAKGQEYPVMIMTKLLSDSLMYVKHKLEPKQLAGFANMFIAGNPTLTIDEIVLILTKGINGEYGKAYGNFDYLVLTDWRSQYEEGDRAIYIESRNHKEAVGDPLRRSSSGESFGEIAKDSMEKINSGKSNFKDNDALSDYKKQFDK